MEQRTASRSTPASVLIKKLSCTLVHLIISWFKFETNYILPFARSARRCAHLEFDPYIELVWQIKNKTSTITVRTGKFDIPVVSVALLCVVDVVAGIIRGVVVDPDVIC
jgi:hypothetical protein